VSVARPAREDVAADLAAELLQRGESVSLSVGGTSMWPLVRGGDRVLLVPGRAARVGEVAAVLRGGRLVVHRVVRAEGGRVVLRGDNRDREDPPVEGPEVLGVVTRQETRGRTIDHRAWGMRLVNRAAALLSRRTRLPWRAAERLHGLLGRGRAGLP
jgi:hypothetical protein